MASFCSANTTANRWYSTCTATAITIDGVRYEVRAAISGHSCCRVFSKDITFLE
jgi:hypothetical protein